MLKKLAEKYNLTNYIEDLENLSSPCLQGRENGVAKGFGCSKIGGFPHAHKNFRWPRYLGTPLEFIAQINLAEVEGSYFPDCGLLLFFYADGVGTGKKQHRDFIRIVHIQENKTLEVHEPPYEYKKRLWGLLKPRKLPKVFDEHSIKFCTAVSLPDLDNVELTPSLSKFDEDDALLDSYCELKYELSEKGVLQIGGYPNPVQFDGLAESAATIMGKGCANDWVLLLEVDSKLGFMWGDAGRLYFYIHKNDLADMRFSEVWMEFQCH